MCLYFCETVHYYVCPCFLEAFSCAVAVCYADGGASGVASHEYVEVGVADDDGVFRLEIKVTECLDDGFGIGLGMCDVFGGDDVGYDVVKTE